MKVEKHTFNTESLPSPYITSNLKMAQKAEFLAAVQKPDIALVELLLTSRRKYPQAILP